MAIEYLSNLFESSFEIPNYQRGYSWQKKQLDDFWTDITNINNVHYMGAIYTETITRKNKNYEILIDGQQRLTTLAILIYELEKKINQNPKKRLFYADGNQNKEFLENVEKDKLEELINEMPNYFYDILPYTYVFNISKKWIKKFERSELRR